MWNIQLTESMIECINSMIILLALMVTNLLLGTINSLAICNIKFDVRRMVEGVCKAIGIAVGSVVLAYAFDNFDLSGLGYTPMTVLSTAIIAYFAKCMRNMIKILGLESKLPIEKTPEEAQLERHKETILEELKEERPIEPPRDIDLGDDFDDRIV